MGLVQLRELLKAESRGEEDLRQIPQVRRTWNIIAGLKMKGPSGKYEKELNSANILNVFVSILFQNIQ